MKLDRFLINDNTLYTGYVESSYDLLEQNNDKRGQKIGGGLYFIDEPNKTIYLYGSSREIGPVNEEMVKNVIIPENFKDYTFVHSELQTSVDIIREFELF